MSWQQTVDRTLHIIHLDDHRIFLDGMRKCILSRYPNALIEQFHTNEQALTRLKEYLHFNKTPDLIITDYNHRGNDFNNPEPNGLEFAQAAKKLTEAKGIRISILMISMVGPKDAIPDGLENSPLDGYLTKAASVEDILGLIQTLIPPVFSTN